ncbi:T9SS type A sorting domain-containing protein [Hanstruepera ponticola]|uniref:T9SS type A sorting domain-containing protein n=1 Tax=Hanstruepera ponticola TaxID=2042995 RepID=UPI001786F194|nr:T9SS type A sorting domain-containing protein [Hanstruepera ponticola]
MRKTNLESRNRLKNQESCCSFRGLLYSKATLFFALLLLPALIFAQSNRQQQLTEKEARNQAYLDAKYGNKVELDQPMVFQKQAVQQVSLSTQSVSTEAERILQKEEIKLRQKGLSDIQIQAELDAIKNPESVPAYYARQGSNDCSNAVEIDCNDGPIAGSTAGFSNAGFINCGGGASAGNGVWYVMTGDNANNVISVTGSGGFAPRVHVYSGSCGAIQCQGGVIGQGTGSASFFAAGGDTYYLYVTGGATASGAYTIELTSANCQAPTGDGLSAATAYPASCGDQYSEDTSGTSSIPGHQQGPSCNGATNPNGVWYVLNVTGDYSDGTGVTLDLCASDDYDTEVHVYEGVALDCVGSDDDSCGINGWRSEFSFDAQPNTDYYIYVGGFGSSSQGVFVMDVLCDGIAPPPPPSIPANDLCADATELNCGETLVDQSTILATGGSSTSCFGTIGNDVWYLVEGTGYGLNLTVNATGDEELQVEVYEVVDANCNNFTLGSCTIGDDGFSNPSVVDFVSDENMIYYVRVGSWISSSPDTTFDITLTCQDPPSPPDNDNCEDAETIVCGDTVSGDTYLATNTGVPFCDSDAPTNSPGVWYAFTGTGEVVDLDLEGVNYDAVISVYTGGCDGLTCVIGENGDFSDDSSVRFLSESGTDYLIFVSGFFGAVGDFNLEISCQPDPCSTAEQISCADTLVIGNNSGANGSTAGPVGTCGTSASSPGVFYEFIGNDQFVNITMCGSNFDTKLNVYTGSCGALECLTGNDDGPTCGAFPERGAEVDFFADSSQTYYIWVSGFSGATGDFQMNITCQNAAVNDTCDSPTALSCGSTDVPGSTELSTDRDAPDSVCDTGVAGPGVWYTVIGQGGDLVVSTCDSANFDTKIIILTGSGCEDLTCVDGNDDGDGCSGGTSEVQFNAVDGQLYYIYVTGFGEQKGDFTISVDCVCYTESTTAECLTLYGGYTDDYSQAVLSGNLLGTDGDVTYSWNTGATSQSITVDAADGTQQYSVTMTDEYGCSSIQEWFVYSIDADCDRGNSNKVEICHNGTTICVNENAVASHLAHGDSIGACGTPLCDELLPFCDASITAPANGETGVSLTPTISWSSATGVVDYYNLVISIGGTEVVNEDVYGLSYTVTTELDYESEYSISLVPFNVNGSGNCDITSSFTTIEDPLPNDDCDGAIALTVNADLNCGVVFAGNNIDSTPSPQPDDVTGTPNTDVWFSFVATSSLHRISLSNVVNVGGGTSTSTDMGMGVYNADSGCESLVFVDDSDPNTLNLSGLTPGDTYVVRVYGWSSTIQYTTFDICVGTPPPPPVNNDCSGAVALTVNTDGTCDITYSADHGTATDSGGTTVTGCDLFGNIDTWYTFVAPASGVVELSTINGTQSGNPGFQVYDTCSGTQLFCSNNLSGTQTVNGLTAGTEYTLAVWFDSGNGTFDICLSEPVVLPPGGDVVTCGVPVNVTYCYGSNEITEWAYQSSDGSPLTLFFNSGEIEESSFSGNAWDDLYIYDGFDNGGILLHEPNDGIVGNADLTGQSFTANSGYLYMYFDSDGSVSCQSSSSYDPWDFDVTCNGSRQANPDLEWSLYPNPSRGQVNLDLKDFVNNDINVQVIDLRGNVVLNRTVQNLQDPKLQIELNNVPYGMYFVRVQSQDNVSTKRLIINN